MTLDEDADSISEAYYQSVEFALVKLASNAIYLVRTKHYAKEDVLFEIARTCGSDVAIEVKKLIERLEGAQHDRLYNKTP